jgi:type IV pilus assembly protein PilM
MAGELAERRGLTLEHSHGWLAHVGLQQPLEDLEGDPEIITEARAVLTEGVHRIAGEVRNSLDFHMMQGDSVAAQRAILTGAAVAIPGFSEALATEVALPLEVGLVAETKPGGFGGVEAGRLAIAAGLTTDEVSA